MTDLNGIRARQEGRNGPYGPQPGQTYVSATAFLIARADIDALLAMVEPLERVRNTLAGLRRELPPEAYAATEVQLLRTFLSDANGGQDVY